MVGKTVQQYQFLEKLAAGGMGEIYRAQDTRLNRFVAIKVLHNVASGEPERRRRFVQEAQAASALNHPNIVTIHDIISEGDAEYMVMEHVQGKTLADLIPKGGLRVPQVLKLGLQMTDALNAAHSAGIIHRDLKPANVMVTDSGLVKVLDFGLAKLTDRGGPVSGGPDDATRTISTQPLTVEGSIMGTVSYMSPEQAQGQKVDSRSDVFSMGVVLYEMVTGDRAFQGDTPIATLSAILRDDPRPLAEVAPDVPGPLSQLIWKCLRKPVDDRFQTMRDVHLAMGSLKYESDSGILYRAGLASTIAAPIGGVSFPSSISPASGRPGAATATSSRDAMPMSSVSGIQSVSGTQESGTIIAPPRSSKLPLLAGAAALIVVAGGAWWFLNRQDSLAEPSPQAAVAALPAASEEQTLTNDSVIQMWDAKVPLATIFGQMRSDRTAFNMSASEVIRLTKAHIPTQVIEAMRDPQNAPILPPPDVATADAGTALELGNPDAATAGEAGVPAVGGRQLALLNGTPFTVILAADISDKADQGQPIRFITKDDVRVGDSVVIAKGATVLGEIAQGAKKRIFGGARMTMRLLTVDAVDGRKYSVRALASRDGDGKAERRVETNVKPTSEDAAASAGTEYIAYADGDLLISVPASNSPHKR